MDILVELPCLPPVSWMALVCQSGQVTLEAHEHYQKGSWRNRYHIAGPNGVQRLSIPLRKGKHQQLPVREVEIDNDQPWQQQHWRSIRTAYGNAPYFEHYKPGLEAFYSQQYEHLFDLNLALFQWLLRQMNIAVDWRLSEHYLPPGQAGDFRGAFLPGTPPQAQLQPYPQVFTEKHGFLPDLSCLDLLLCCGRQATEILRSSRITL